VVEPESSISEVEPDPPAKISVIEEWDSYLHPVEPEKKIIIPEPTYAPIPDPPSPPSSKPSSKSSFKPPSPKPPSEHLIESLNDPSSKAPSEKPS
jgi:hypothetical protein